MPRLEWLGALVAEARPRQIAAVARRRLRVEAQLFSADRAGLRHARLGRLAREGRDQLAGARQTAELRRDGSHRRALGRVPLERSVHERRERSADPGDACLDPRRRLGEELRQHGVLFGPSNGHTPVKSS
jgi:hypothetical protein